MQNTPMNDASRLPFGIHPGYTKLPDNINLIWKIIGEKNIKIELI